MRTGATSGEAARPNRGRRRLLAWGAALGAVSLGVALAARVTDGAPAPRVPSLTRLDGARQQALAALADALLDGTLPQDPAARAARVDATLTAADDAIARFPQALRDELDSALAVLTFAPARFALIGRWSGWAQPERAEVAALLEGLRTSGFAVRRQIYMGVRDLVMSAYYADRAAWAEIGYPGPLVDNRVELARAPNRDAPA